MVKRIVLGILLVLVIGTAVWQNIYIHNATEKLTADLERIREALNADELQIAAEAADEFCTNWDECQKTFEALFEHKEVDTISATARSIQSLCSSGEKEEALSQIAAELFYINHIKDIDTLGWENVF